MTLARIKHDPPSFLQVPFVSWLFDPANPKDQVRMESMLAMSDFIKFPALEKRINSMSDKEHLFPHLLHFDIKCYTLTYLNVHEFAMASRKVWRLPDDLIWSADAICIKNIRAIIHTINLPIPPTLVDLFLSYLVDEYPWKTDETFPEHMLTWEGPEIQDMKPSKDHWIKKMVGEEIFDAGKKPLSHRGAIRVARQIFRDNQIRAKQILANQKG